MLRFTANNLLATAVAFLLVDVSWTQISIDGCGDTKACFQDPVNCEASSPDCRFVSWKKSASGDTYEFEISGGSGKGEEYVAIAFGISGQMRDADVYYCDGTELKSGVIRQQHEEPMISNKQNGVVVKSAVTANGVAQCVFERSRSVRKKISGNQFHEFDLGENKYWLLVAVGAMSADGRLEYHTFRTLTSASHDFSESAPVIPIEYTTTTPGPEPSTDKHFHTTISAACLNKMHILYFGLGILLAFVAAH